MPSILSCDGEVTFLIVDDDDVDVMAMKRALRKHGVDNSVVVAENGKVALEQLQQAHEGASIQRFVILLDIKMPVMGGLEFLQALRSGGQSQYSVVFVLTTSDDSNDIVSAYEKFVAGYFLKSEVGDDFSELVPMLKKYATTVKFPP